MGESEVTTEILRDTEHMADLVNKYGFAFIFVAIAIILLAVAAFVMIKTWNKRENAKLEMEKERSKEELEVSRKERMSNIEQTQSIYKLVNDIQAEQVIQLKNLSSIIERMKDDVVIGTSAGKNAIDTIEKTDDDVKRLDGKVENFKDAVLHELDELRVKVDTCVSSCTDANNRIKTLIDILSEDSSRK